MPVALMSSIYTSLTSNVTHVNSESNVKFHVQANTTTFTTTTRYASTTAPPKDLSTTAIVLIVLAVVVIFLLCGLIFYIYRRRKHRKPPPPPPPPKPSAPPVTPSVSWVKSPAKFDAPPRSTPHHFKPHPAHSAASPLKPLPVHPSLQCRQPICKEYLTRLNLSEAYFATKYDRCFCKKCHDSSDPNVKCGSWCTQFHGWIRFGLRLNEAHKKQWKIFNEWETSYYGTSPDRLSSILRNRFVPLDRDSLADGTTFRSGHPDEDYCTTSPSLAYASQDRFTARLRFRATDKNEYYVRVVLQCKQQLDTIIVRTDPTSPKNIEWATKARCSVVPFGLLIRLQKI